MANKTITSKIFNFQTKTINKKKNKMLTNEYMIKINIEQNSPKYRETKLKYLKEYNY